ncbi:MAG: MarR family transcriptional regulator [Dehalococcoidia bacterium]|jgi:DNA-binding MarR family transcriptional regulator
MAGLNAFGSKVKLSEEIFSIAPAHELWVVAWTFAQTFTIYAKGHERLLANWQVTTSQWLTLWLLFLSDKPLTLTEISRAMPIEAHSVGAVLDRLVERNLIKRRRSRNDRRTILITITEPGYQLLRNVSPDEGSFIENVVGTLSKSDRESLRRISKKMRNNVLKLMSLDPKRADAILKQLTDGIGTFQGKIKKGDQKQHVNNRRNVAKQK